MERRPSDLECGWLIAGADMQIHGKGRMLLIRWSGYEMAEGGLTHKDHLETDYAGLQAQLTRRRTERS